MEIPNNDLKPENRRRRIEENLDYAQNLSSLIEIIDKKRSTLMNPSEADIHYDRGLESALKHDYQNAIKSFSKALEFNSEFGDALFMKGMLHHKEGNYEEALEEIEKALPDTTRKEEAYYIYGDILEKMQMPEKARESFAEVLKLNPDNRYARKRLNGL